jgi:very-short-patch-repair endonuclease
MLSGLLRASDLDVDQVTAELKQGICCLGYFDQIGENIILQQQWSFGSYRVDFSLYAVKNAFTDDPINESILAIECDGHDYHERTKEQASRDRARDRWFQSQDIPIMRFTGSEIWRDGERCATEAITAFLNITASKWGLAA